MARFTDLRSDLENICNVKDQRTLVNRTMNRTMDRIAGFQPWPFYLDEAFFATVDDYSTGTITVANGSTTVTGASTVFTAAMVGRKLRVESEQAYYKISAFVSATELTLEQAYQGSLTSGNDYTIYQDEYRLKPNVHIPHLLRQIQNGWALSDIDPGDFDLAFPTPVATGDPSISVPIGTRRDVYSTGTVSGTSGATTITGSSTAWTSVQGLDRGSRIRIGDNVYTVKSVDSATSITIFETLSATVSGTTYQIFLDNIRVQLYTIPDAARNIYYRFYRSPDPLVNDYDEPDLPSDWQWLIITGSLADMWDHKGAMDKSAQAEQKFFAGLNRLKSQYRSVSRVYQRNSQTAGTRRLQPRFPAGTDIRAHAP